MDYGNIPKERRAQIYLQTQSEARKNRKNFKINTDPILQRDDKYEGKRRVKLETEKYFMNVEEKEERPRKKKIPQKDKFVLTDNYSAFPIEDVKYIPHKKAIAQEYENKIHQQKPKSLKRVNCKARQDVIGDIFTRKGEIPHQKIHLKMCANNGKPSEEYTRMNEKKSNLPHHKPFPKKVRKEETFSDIFGGDGKVLVKERAHKRNVKMDNSQIGNLLQYDNTPYGYDSTTEKPNQMSYDDLVRSIKMNRKDKMWVKKK